MRREKANPDRSLIPPGESALPPLILPLPPRGSLCGLEWKVMREQSEGEGRQAGGEHKVIKTIWTGRGAEGPSSRHRIKEPFLG